MCSQLRATVSTANMASSAQAVEILGTVLQRLSEGSQSDDGDGLLTDPRSVDTAFSTVCNKLGLVTADLMDIKFALLGFAALAEFDSFAKEING